MSLTLVLAVVAFTAYALLARLVLHGPVDPMSLAEAVARDSGSADQTLGSPSEGCRRLSTTKWECAVSDSQGSGGVTYRVGVEPDGSCWQAKIAMDYSEGGMPRRVSGCVYRWQWTLLDLF